MVDSWYHHGDIEEQHSGQKSQFKGLLGPTIKKGAFLKKKWSHNKETTT